MPRSRVRVAAAIVALAAWAAIAGGALAADQDVSIAGFAFAPGIVTVNVGDTVTWTNNDQVGHTATGSGFDTGTVAGGSSASVTFDTAGTFDYVCSIHSTMSGTVIVQAAGGNGGPTTPSTDTAGVVARDDAPSGAGPAAAAVLALAFLGGFGLVERRLARRRAD